MKEVKVIVTDNRDEWRERNMISKRLDRLLLRMIELDRRVDNFFSEARTELGNVKDSLKQIDR